jgi:hypothetical protein
MKTGHIFLWPVMGSQNKKDPWNCIENNESKSEMVKK